MALPSLGREDSRGPAYRRGGKGILLLRVVFLPLLIFRLSLLPLLFLLPMALFTRPRKPRALVLDRGSKPALESHYGILVSLAKIVSVCNALAYRAQKRWGRVRGSPLRPWAHCGILVH